MALRSRVIHCLAFCFAHYSGAGVINHNDLHNKDPEENHGEPSDYISVKNCSGRKNVLTRSAIREPFVKNKAIFDCVGLATNFWSSLAPCPSAMVARSRHKNLCCLLVKYDFIFYEWYKYSRASFCSL